MHLAVLLGLLLLGADKGSPPVAEADLEWRSGPRDDYETQTILLSPDPRSGFGPLPDGHAKAPLYGTVTLADNWQIFFAADLARGHPALWLDTDADRQLDDERPIAFGRGSEGFELTMAIRRGSERIQVRFAKRPDDDGALLRVSPLAHREGQLVLEGRLRRIAIYDASGDLRFDRPERDGCFLDLDGDGLIDRAEDSPERILPGLAFPIRGHGYILRIDGASAARVSIRRAEQTPPPRVREWKAIPLETPAGRRAPGSHQTLAQIKKRYTSLRKLERRNRQAMKMARTWIFKDAGELGTVPAFNFLHQVYSKEKGDAGLRALAVESMGYLDYASRADTVFEIARKATGYLIKAAALRALHGMAAEGRESAMREGLLGANGETLAEAASMGLVGTGDASARRILLAAARELPLSACRYHAYRAGTRYWPEPPPTELVLSVAGEEDLRLRKLGLQDARTLGLPESYDLALEGAKLATLDPDLLHEVVLTLGAVGDATAIDAILPLASHAAPKTFVRMVALLSLARDPAAEAKLVDALENGQAPATRRLAARVLANIPGEAISRALVDRLDREKNRETLQALTLAVGRRGVPGAIDPLRAVAAKGGAIGRAALEALAAIGLDQPDVLSIFEARAKTGTWEDRVTLLDALATSQSPLAAPLMIAALDHEVWQVRLAAVQGLGRVRARESIEPLIARLEAGDSKRLRRALAATLYRITGKNLLDDPRLWRAWWKDAAETFVIPPEVDRLPSAGRRTVATFYGVPVDSDRVIFVLDQSGSMRSRRKKAKGESKKRTELQYAVEETLRVARRMGEESKANVICFESEVHPWKGELMPLESRHLGALARYLRSRKPDGATNLFDALEQALRTDEVDTIYLLSDGSPTAGSLTMTEHILDAVREINRTRRITIHCISLGNDSELLERLANESAGIYVRR